MRRCYRGILDFVNCDLLLDICAAITCGLRLTARQLSVGLHQADPMQWACRDRNGKPIPAIELEPRTMIRHSADRCGWSAQIVLYAEPDWSAFGAARLFLLSVGDGPARQALKAAKFRRRRTSPRAP